MFIDSQGNVCPCDFTMLSFGNILERPIQEIWEETSKHFCTPGRACYANISNDVIFSKKKAEWLHLHSPEDGLLDRIPNLMSLVGAAHVPRPCLSRGEHLSDGILNIPGGLLLP